MAISPAAVLFDLDGTLVDTEPVWDAAERAVVDRYQGRWSDELRQDLVGIGLEEGAFALWKHTGLQGITPEGVAQELIARVSSGIVRGEAQWCPGAQEILQRLLEQEIPAYIVTSSHSPMAEAVLNLMDPGLVQGYVAGDQVSAVKPHPEPYLNAAAALNVSIEQCLVVEDSPYGIAAGLNAGAVTVAVPNQVEIASSPNLSRFNSLHELDEQIISRLMCGEIIDTYAQVG